MSSLPNFSVDDPFVRRPWRLPSGVAFYLQASIVVAFLAASSAPTPLYAVYQGEWGFSPITTTVVFGIYALAVLAALLTVCLLYTSDAADALLCVDLGGRRI